MLAMFLVFALKFVLIWFKGDLNVLKIIIINHEFEKKNIS